MTSVSRHGAWGTDVAGVFITESALPAGRPIRRAQVESRRQNIGLTQLKEQLAAQAAASGANAVANFTYQQSATIFSFSDIRWVAEGDLVVISSVGAEAGHADPPPPSVPAGWYPDPSGPGRRYWDGLQWSEHVAP